MRAGDDPEPAQDAGDPACWAHVFDRDDDLDEDEEEDTPEVESAS